MDSVSAQFDRGEYQAALEPAHQAWMQSKPGTEWNVRFQLMYAQLLVWNGKSNDATAVLKQAPPPQYPALLPRYQYLRAWILFRSDASAAEQIARSAVRGARHFNDALTETDALLLIASRPELKPQLKREAAVQALDAAKQHGLATNEASALLDLGKLEMDQKRFAAAINYSQQAAHVAAGHNHYAQVQALSNLGECYYKVGAFDQSDRTLAEARRLLLSADGNTLKFYVNYESGYLYLLRGRLKDAEAFFRQAMALASKGDNRTIAAVELAETLLKLGSVDEASKYNDEALSTFTADPKRITERGPSIDLNRADIAAVRGQLQSAAEMYQKVIRAQSQYAASSVQWSAFSRLGTVQQKMGQWTAAKQSFDQALSSIEAGRSAQKSAEYQIYFLSDLIVFYRDYVELLAHQREEEMALAVADSSRASVLNQGHLTSRQMPHIYASLQNLARSSKSLILFYWLAEKSTYLWAITPAGARMFTLPGDAEIKRDVESYNRSIQSDLQDTLGSSNAAGRRLYKTLLGQVIGSIPAQSNVIIVPDGALHNLNFETLLTDTPKPHYWIDDVTVTVAPSLSILLAAKKTTTPAVKTALLMGDPNYKAPEFQPLPYSAVEIASVRKHFAGATVITKGDAQVATFRNARPERFATIHIATHVAADAQSPLNSAIILSGSDEGNRLYARDFANSRLSANLVTISGCRSAGATNLSGEGLVGFAWASLHAGAQNAVTSLWEVDDRSTADLMDHFYKGVTSGKSYASSLRDAKRLMMKSYRKPYNWAPFQLYSRSVSR